MKFLSSILLCLSLAIGFTGCKKAAQITATCSDGIKNQNETSVDCDGACLPCHCSDGMKNGTETAVDCGGLCLPCSLCNDGIQNQGETSIDCGGPCPGICPTCSDGIKNGNETGIDCGGSCPSCFLGSYLVTGTYDSYWGSSHNSSHRGPSILIVTGSGSTINLSDTSENYNQDATYYSETDSSVTYRNVGEGGCTFGKTNERVTFAWGHWGGVYSSFTTMSGTKIH